MSTCLLYKLVYGLRISLGRIGPHIHTYVIRVAYSSPLVHLWSVLYTSSTMHIFARMHIDVLTIPGPVNLQGSMALPPVWARISLTDAATEERTLFRFRVSSLVGASSRMAPSENVEKLSDYVPWPHKCIWIARQIGRGNKRAIIAHARKDICGQVPLPRATNRKRKSRVFSWVCSAIRSLTPNEGSSGK